MSKFKILKDISLVSGAEIFLIIFAVLKNKYIAYTLGPEGFGMYGLLNSFFAFISVFAGSWISVAVTKYIAEYASKNDINNVKSLVSISVILPIILSTILSILLILCRKLTIKYFLSSEITDLYFVFFSIAFIARTLNPIIGSIFQGLKNVKSYALLKSGSVFIELIFIVCFIYLFDLLGFFVGIFISSTLSGIIYLITINKKIPVSIQLINIDSAATKRLLNFGKVNFFLSVFYLFAQYFQRKVILKHYDMNEVGLLQGGLLIMQYLTIFGRSIAFVFYPKMAEYITSEKRKSTISYFMNLSLFINIPILLLFLLFGNNIIGFVFSDKFIGLNDTIFYFALAAFLQNISFIYHYVILGTEKLLIHSLLTILGTSIILIIPLIFAEEYGIVVAAVSHIIASLIGLIVSHIYIKKNIVPLT